MTERYLVVRRRNSHGEYERSAIGPFRSESQMIRFAQGIRFATGSMDNILGTTSQPWALWINSPNDLFPWTHRHIPSYNPTPETQDV